MSTRVIADSDPSHSAPKTRVLRGESSAVAK